MKYPVLTGTAARRLHIAALDGGICRQNGARLIADNQLADGENIWWRDGALRERPAFLADRQSVRTVSSPLNVEAEYCVTQTVATGCIAHHDGIYGEYVAAIRHLDGTVYGAAAEIEISLLLIDGTRIDTETIFVKDDEGALPHRTVLLVKGDTGIVGDGVFAFVDGGRIFELCHEYAYASQTHRYYWARVTDRVTAPVVMTAGRGYHTETGRKQDASGVTVRSFNALTDRFLAEYTTDGQSNGFVLPLKAAPAAVDTVTYTDPAGQVHTFLAGRAEINNQTVTLSVVGNTVQFLSNGQPFCFADSTVASNLVIAARYGQAEGVSKFDITAMTAVTWFGGAAGGLTGGGRVFFAGSERQPGLICWSAAGDPLYIPISNYTLVGDAAEPITALARQSDMLVILKEHSVYCATYTADAVEVDRVAAGGVTDLDAASAVFPITPLHAHIGCDCPRSVALCDNRLVWATTDRRVYTLTAANPFSECNVAELSAPIADKLRGHTADEMAAAVACDFDGHYLLFVGDEVAVMAYTDASPRWYWWKAAIGAKPIHAMARGEALAILAEQRESDQPTGDTVRWVTVLLGAGPDLALLPNGRTEQRRVTGFVRTKSFDFGQPHRRKRILRVYPDSEADGEWQLITDRGDTVPVSGGVLTPSVPATVTLGLQTNFSGVVALTGVSVVYRPIGERKE